MLTDFFDMLFGWVFEFLAGFFSLFPPMPIGNASISQFLSLPLVNTVFDWVNYFLPLDVASSIVAVWSAGMMAYVGIKLAMRYSNELVS